MPHENLNVIVNPEWKRIGISLSGGADSALMAYLICLNTDAEIHITTQIRCWKTRPWQRHISVDVFNWLRHKFSNLTFHRHENFIPPDLEWADKGPTILDENGKLKSGNQIILRSYNEYICHEQNLDAWFAAVNKNPDIKIEGALQDRDNGHIDPITKHMGVTVCHPFIHTTKDAIIQKYYDLGITELLHMTRSCEGDDEQYPEIFKGLDYRTYQPGQEVPTCKKCFWCKERQWAMDRVNV